MRTRVFRILAGLLAVLFVWALSIGDHSRFSWREWAGYVMITVLFSLFALLGPQSADRWLMLWFGTPSTKSVPERASDMGEHRQEKQWPTEDKRHGPAAPDQLR